MRYHSLLASAALGVASVLTGCAAESTGPAGATPPRTISLSLSATGPLGNASASLGGRTASSLTVTGSTVDALVITKVQLVLARLELQRSGATCTSSASAGDDERADESCAQLELAPTIVTVPVDGSIANALSVSVPSGSYSAFEAKIRPVEARRNGSAAFLAAHPEFAGVSVRVEGTFNGKAFTFLGAPSAQLESVFNPPLVADASGINITVRVDLTNWFRTPAGALIDPASANAGAANAGLVSGNITRSFSAFRDDDHNGHDDHGHDGGDDNGRNSGHG